MRQWNIDVFIDRRGSDWIASFRCAGKLLGSARVARHLDSPDFAFAAWVRNPSNWLSMGYGLYEALLTYRQELAQDVDYRIKTYRFLPVIARAPWSQHWILTSDKRDIHPHMMEQIAA